MYPLLFSPSARKRREQVGLPVLTQIYHQDELDDFRITFDRNGSFELTTKAAALFRSVLEVPLVLTVIRTEIA